MKDALKRCCVTIHPIGDRLGPAYPEYALKEKKRKSIQHPPTNYYKKAQVGCDGPLKAFIWYTKKSNEDPDLVCVDVTIDGKRTKGLVVESGKANGLLVEHEKALSGSIEVIFWRVMNVDGDLIPDEGVPALAVFQLVRLDKSTPKMPLLESNRSELSSFVDPGQLKQIKIDEETFEPKVTLSSRYRIPVYFAEKVGRLAIDPNDTPTLILGKFNRLSQYMDCQGAPYVSIDSNMVELVSVQNVGDITSINVQ